MGGYVYVTTGLLKAADNEAQLVSVLAHEIGHVDLSTHPATSDV
jgi:predicted Zn-dependent protease